MTLVRSLRSRRPSVGSFGLVLALALTTGCGGAEGVVSGKVLFQGKPLPGGVVTFRPVAGKKTVATPIDPDGNFRATLPVGEVQIAVDNRELQPQAAPADIAARISLPPGVKAKLLPAKGGVPPEMGAASERPPGTYVPIPGRYYDAVGSGLTYTVKSGPQPFDIELK